MSIPTSPRPSNIQISTGIARARTMTGLRTQYQMFFVHIHNVEFRKQSVHIRVALCTIEQSIHATSIPMVGSPIDVLGCGMIGIEEVFGPMNDVIFVVIENEEFDVGVRFGQLRSEVVGDEVSLGVVIEGAGVPRGGKFWFVLDCDSVEVDAVVLVTTDEFTKIQRPTLGILAISPNPIPYTNRQSTPRHILRMGHKSSILIFLRWCLHPTGWTPRRGDDAHPSQRWIFRFFGIGIA
mmetsp:Transcript_12036/g.24898  ORF Transcript_12036/g.24898 Transcript_12036/m.24898 type:complete len:237 (+) Transcript_12036:173-883(+)